MAHTRLPDSGTCAAAVAITGSITKKAAKAPDIRDSFRALAARVATAPDRIASNMRREWATAPSPPKPAAADEREFGRISVVFSGAAPLPPALTGLDEQPVGPIPRFPKNIGPLQRNLMRPLPTAFHEQRPDFRMRFDRYIELFDRRR